MKRYALILAALALFAAGAASAAITITLNGYRGVTVALEPIGLCGSSGDCTFMVTVNGTVLDSTGGARSQETLQFRSDSASVGLNPSTVTTFYRRSRKAWKATALADDTE